MNHEGHEGHEVYLRIRAFLRDLRALRGKRVFTFLVMLTHDPLFLILVAFGDYHVKVSCRPALPDWDI